MTPATGGFPAASIWSNNGGVQFSFHESVPARSCFADIEFIASNSTPLAPSIYLHASNFQFAPPGAPIREFGISVEEQDGAIRQISGLSKQKRWLGSLRFVGFARRMVGYLDITRC
jgi:hypothetical protein